MIETDAEMVFSQFRNFTAKEMKRSLTNTVKKAGRQLVKETKTELRNSGVQNTNRKNPKYYDTLQQGVRMTRVYQMKDGSLATKVRIDSNRMSGSGSFRLMILEKGNYKTRPRFAYKRSTSHKLSNRGNIKAYNFFANARNKFMPEYDNIFSQAFSQSVSKINNKKFGK